MSFFDFIKNIISSNKQNCNREFSITPYDYNIDENEGRFITALLDNLKANGLNEMVRISIVSKTTLNFVYSDVGQIGRVKIKGRKTKMQFLDVVWDSANCTPYFPVLWEEDLTVDEMIQKIPLWIVYIEKFRKYKKRKIRFDF